MTDDPSALTNPQHSSQKRGFARHRRLLSIAGRYAIGAACPFVAYLLQSSVWPYIPPSPFLFFWPAVLIAALLGGFGPSVLAIAISGAMLAYRFLPPINSFAIASPVHVLDLSLFLGMSLVLAWYVGRNARLRRAAEHAHQLAEREGRAREHLLGVISHDLKGPLTSIGLSAAQIGLSARHGRLEGVTEVVNRIQRSVDRMDRLVRGVIDIARVDARSVHLSRESVSVRSLFEEAEEMFAALAEHKRVNLKVTVLEGNRVFCDRDRILRVLSNLIGNAIEIVPSGGSIEVSARKVEGDVVFEVSDTGPGIRSEHLPRLFEPYWKADQRASGSGLGLYIAKLLVEAHGGRIWATTNGGATFHFTLPEGGAPPDPEAGEPGRFSGSSPGPSHHVEA